MPPSAIFFYWVTRAALTAFLVTALLAGLYYSVRFLLELRQKRLPPGE